MAWEQNLKREPYGMGIHTHNSHSEWIGRFEVQYPGFRAYERPGGSSEIEVAGEIYHHFHSHYYKLISTFLRDCPKYKTVANFTNSEKIVVVDIGSGVGTTAYSVLDVYSELKTDLSRLHIIFVDPCTVRHLLRNVGLKDYDIRRYSGLSVTTSSITASYPDCQQNIIDELRSFQGFNLIIVMSNVLSWVSDPSAAANKVSELVMECPQHEVAVVNVEPKNYGNNLVAFYNQLDNRLDRILVAGLRDSVQCKNPTKSKWMQKFGMASYNLQYHNSIAELIAYNAKIGTYANIAASYHSTAVAYRTGVFYDEVEMKLTSSCLEDNIRELSGQIQYGYKYNQDVLSYYVPKKNGDNRPLIVDSFYNELINSTLMRYWGFKLDQGFDRFSEVSYGERLAGPTEITIYKNYYDQYFKRYIGNAKKYAQDYGYYAKVDIKSFYKNIDQDILHNRLTEGLNPKDNKFSGLLHSLIKRDVPDSETGRGIFQGSSISGFLANVYLALLDNDMIKRHDVAYARYVDDIYLFSNDDSNLTKVLEDIRHNLANRDFLEVHDSGDPSKNARGETAELINNKVFEDDTVMSKLGSKINGLVQSLYFINSLSEQKRFADNPEEFSLLYKECLKAIGVNISQKWLVKKLQKNTITTIYLRPFFNFKRWLTKRSVFVLEWVDLPQTAEGVSTWKSKFVRKNSSFFNLLERSRQELKEFAENCSNEYDIGIETSDKYVTQSLRRLKFTLRRLGIIFNSDATHLFRKYLDKPWVLHQKFIVPYNELLPEILTQLNQTEITYSKLRAIWLLGEWCQMEAQVVLRNEYLLSLKNEKTIYNVLATEALLKLGKDACNGVANETKEYIDEELIRARAGLAFNYHKLRNAFLILNLVAPDSILVDAAFEIDYRMKIVNRYLTSQKGHNILEVPEVVIDNMEGAGLLPVLEPVYTTYSA